MRHDVLFASAVLSLFVLGCESGPPAGDGGDDPCSVHASCGACEPTECDFCAGRCVTRPEGFSFADDEWCDWGHVGNVAECDQLTGIAQVESQLPIDCRNSRNLEELRCNPETPGSVGAGPRFPEWSFGSALEGAFLDVASRTLYVAATQSADAMNWGALMAVDLDSGDRRLVSGRILDPRTGMVEVGTGPMMGMLVDVQPHPEGGFVVWDEANGFLRVLADGTRSVIHSIDDACQHGGFPWNWLNTVHSPAMAIAPDGTIYVSLGRPSPLPDGTDPPNWEEPMAIAALEPAGCRMVTVASVHPEWQLANGPVPQGQIGSLLLDGGALYANAGFGDYYRVDLTTGDRVAISDISEGVGSGGTDAVRPGEGGFVRGPANTFWAAGGESNIGRAMAPVMFTEIDLTTGDAIAHHQVYLSGGGSVNFPDTLLRHPDSDDWVILVNQDAVLIAEHTTGNLNFLSF